MAELHIVLNRDELTVDDWAMLDDWRDSIPPKGGQVRDFLARMAVDDQGAPVPYDQALRQVGQIKLTEFSAILSDALKTLRGEAVPNPSGSASTTPSGTADTDPAGSTR